MSWIFLSKDYDTVPPSLVGQANNLLNGGLELIARLGEDHRKLAAGAPHHGEGFGN